MKILSQIVVVLLLTFAFSPYVLAGAEKAKSATTDKDLEVKYVAFERFAKDKVQQLNRNHKNSRSRMEVVQQKDGRYRARYHLIDDSSLRLKVRRSQSDTIPYVGTLSYKERVFESVAGTAKSFDPELFAVVEVIPNRHIFSYRKGSWN